MDETTKKLIEYFPGASETTRLTLLGPGTRLVIRKQPITLSEYDVGEGNHVYAAYSPVTDTIYMRFVELR